MSSRHLFEHPDGLVNRSLRGLVAYNPSLALIEGTRVVYDTTHDKSKVSVISGGGAGHEPAWPGYVGHNMLAASVSGDIFASPSTKQILSGIASVPSDKGTILCLGNYTGDCLHFGLACEKANTPGKPPCGILICGDDVSVGRKGSLVGRRGLAGQISVLKVMGAAAEAGASFEDTLKLGTEFSKSMVSIAATLDHCHVPGRAEHAMLKPDEVEIGTGPHNEPGYRKISPIPTPESFISQILDYCLNPDDKERSYVPFKPGDEVALLVSNFGGMSPLEMGALLDELLNQLEKTYKIEPTRVYCGPLETSLNAPAFSTSIINMTVAAKDNPYSVKQIKEFLDVRTNTQWEAVSGHQSVERKRAQQFVAPPKEAERTVDAATDLKVNPTVLEKMIRTACEAIVEREPDLTRWDTEMGDGDCGETLKTGATEMLAALDKGLAKTGSVIAVMHELEHVVENKMGGTLGGILGIFFAAMTNSLQQNTELGKTKGIVEQWAVAVQTACTSLRRYTPAKVGDRTVMDVFIPFAESMHSSGSFAVGVDEAVRAAEATKTMQPRLGRATYVGGTENKVLPPDPGAWGAMEVIQGLQKGMNA